MAISDPKVSVTIPVFNARYIGRAIDSVLSQTYKDFELVVVDNCSTDSTAEIVSKYSDPRIRFLKNATNIGASPNWTRAVQEGKGKYIKLLFADDFIYPNCLELQVAVLDDPKNEGVAMVCARRDIVNPEGSTILRARGLRRFGRNRGDAIITRVLRTGRNSIGEPLAVLFRAADFARAGVFDGSNLFCADLDMWCRLLRFGDLYVCSEVVGAYRVSGQTFSKAIAGRQASQGRQFLDHLYSSGGTAVGSLGLAVGKLRCTRDAYLRRLIYWLTISKTQS